MQIVLFFYFNFWVLLCKVLKRQFDVFVNFEVFKYIYIKLFIKLWSIQKLHMNAVFLGFFPLNLSLQNFDKIYFEYIIIRGKEHPHEENKTKNFEGQQPSCGFERFILFSTRACENVVIQFTPTLSPYISLLPCLASLTFCCCYLLFSTIFPVWFLVIRNPAPTH